MRCAYIHETPVVRSCIPLSNAATKVSIKTQIFHVKRSKEEARRNEVYASRLLPKYAFVILPTLCFQVGTRSLQPEASPPRTSEPTKQSGLPLPPTVRNPCDKPASCTHATQPSTPITPPSPSHNPTPRKTNTQAKSKANTTQPHTESARPPAPAHSEDSAARTRRPSAPPPAVSAAVALPPRLRGVFG